MENSESLLSEAQSANAREAQKAEEAEVRLKEVTETVSLYLFPHPHKIRTAYNLIHSSCFGIQLASLQTNLATIQATAEASQTEKEALEHQLAEAKRESTDWETKHSLVSSEKEGLVAQLTERDGHVQTATEKVGHLSTRGSTCRSLPTDRCVCSSRLQLWKRISKSSVGS